jgi:secreted trypsin-like serine protease
LYIFDTDSGRYNQVGIVSGGVGECGTERLPGVFTRVNDPEILEFITESAGLPCKIVFRRYTVA